MVAVSSVCDFDRGNFPVGGGEKLGRGIAIAELWNDCRAIQGCRSDHTGPVWAGIQSGLAVWGDCR